MVRAADCTAVGEMSIFIDSLRRLSYLKASNIKKKATHNQAIVETVKYRADTGGVLIEENTKTYVGLHITRTTVSQDVQT